MSIKSSTLDGETFFLSEEPDVRVLGPYTSVFRLFEHECAPGIVVWYGVVDVSVTALELNRAAHAAGVPDAAPGFMHNPATFRLRVELDDGRWGLAKQWTSQWEEGVSGQLTKIVFVCHTALTMKPSGRSDRESAP